MNVYDFDKTIYKNDSTADFYFFELKKNPKILLSLPSLILAVILWQLGFFNKTQFKERFYRFLLKIDDIDSEVESFWDTNQHKIKNFYKIRQQEDDVIISASPEFLLKPICKRLGIKYVYASKVDKKSGKYSGENCWGAEKPKRFHESFGKDAVIDEFYSDSYSDTPLAEIAEKSYIVKGEHISPWQYKKKNKTFFSCEFLLFLIVGSVNTLNGIFFSWLYSVFFNPNIAFVTGYLTSLTIAYFLNAALIFHAKLKIADFIKFCMSYIPNFIIQNIILILFYNILEWNKLIAYVLAAVIGIPITFLAVKFFAFGKMSNTERSTK